MRFISLKKPSDFKKTYQGIKFYTACFSVHFIPAPTPSVDMVQYGITVSKKMAGNAIIRNRMKRHLKESFRQYALCPEIGNYQIVFTSIRKAHEKTWDDYVRAMRKLPELIKKYEQDSYAPQKNTAL